MRTTTAFGIAAGMCCAALAAAPGFAQAVAARPGTPVSDPRGAIAAGIFSPKVCFLEGEQMGLRVVRDDADRSAAIQPLLAHHAPGEAGGPRSDPPSSTFAYFEGFETYLPLTSLGVDPAPVGRRLAGQIQPCNLPAIASSMVSAVTLPASALTGAWTYSPAVPVGRNPYTPGMAGGYPADRDSGVEQALMIGNGSRANRLGDAARMSDFAIGYSLRAPQGALYAPASATVPVIVMMDFYSGDGDGAHLWSPVSFEEGHILTRIAMFGYDFTSALAEADGHILRPQVLGPLANNFQIGQMFAPPKSPAPGLPTFVCKTGEWFTVAVRLTTTSIEVFIRDSGTDASSGILIDDSRDLQYFESGWASIYPGQDATAAGAGVWRGYGRAVTEFGELALRPSPLIAAVTCDGVQSLIGGDPTPQQVPAWRPSNAFEDNFVLIGPALATPSVPPLQIPYLDDMELYTANGPLALQGGRWFDALSSRAEIDGVHNTTPPPGSNGSAVPHQSVTGQSIIEDSVMRPEFSTHVAPGSAFSPDFDPSERVYARPGFPMNVNVQQYIVTHTAYEIEVRDNSATTTSAMLIAGASNHNDVTDKRYYIRLPNPTFNAANPTSSDVRTDEVPNLAANGAVINWPTGTGTVGISFHKIDLVVWGDGTAEWLHDGAALVFSSAFYSLDPRLEEELRKAKRIQVGLPPGAAVSGPYTRFLTELKTCDEIAFWAGNQLGGFGDERKIDDLSVSGALRAPGSGPSFTLDYYDTLQAYTLDEPIAGQGSSPVLVRPPDSNTAVRVRPGPIGTGYFCRYELVSVAAQPDPSMGGSLFPVPPGWSAGAVVAIDSAFVPESNGVRRCPGVLNAPTTYRLFTAQDRTSVAGSWILRSSAVPSCGDPAPVGAATMTAQGGDVTGYIFNARSAPRWDDLIDASFIASGRAGDGWVRAGTTTLDSVKSAAQGVPVSVDPAGAFGQVLVLENTHSATPAPRTEYLSAAATLPLAQASPLIDCHTAEYRAGIYADFYVQDLSTRLIVNYMGEETDCDAGAALVAALRFGGPDSADGISSDHFARLVSSTASTWADTGVAVPVGRWFRVGFILKADGTWQAGYNDFGAPGGPGAGSFVPDRDWYYTGGDPNAHTIASGSSLLGPSGLAINNLDRVTFAQGADTQGDGVVSPLPLDVESLGPTSPRPVGGGVVDAFSFCMYELRSLDPGATIQIADINPQSGSADSNADGQPDLRPLSLPASDIIAVRFNNIPANGPVITYSQCPQNAPFRIFPPGGAGGSPGATGAWQLLGIPDLEGVALPKGGIANPAGPGAVVNGGNLKGYNDPNRPTRNILLAKFVSIPAIPAPEIASRWCVDNIALRKTQGSVVAACLCTGDFNGDGLVGSSDMAFILGAWTSPSHPFNPGTETVFDLNHDNQVGSADLANLLGQWGPC